MKIAIVPWNFYTKLDPKFTSMIFFTVDQDRKPVAVMTRESFVNLAYPYALSLLKALTDAQGNPDAITAALHSIEEFNADKATVQEMSNE